ncbi:MAG: 6-bladed beta-propeller [Gemmatimonadales bacterium]
MIRTRSEEHAVVGSCKYFGPVGRRALLVGLSVLTAGLLACSSDSPAKFGTPVVRDSAGIQIVENTTPIWSDGDAWLVDTVPSVRIGGEAEDSVPLVGVRRARVMADGRIVVASGRTDEVLLFDSLGNFQRVIGGSGKGPGEFSRVEDLYKCVGDTLVVNDFSRVSFFNAHGQHVRTTRVGREICGCGGIRILCLDYQYGTTSEDRCGIVRVLAMRSKIGGYLIGPDAFLESYAFLPGCMCSRLNEAT